MYKFEIVDEVLKITENNTTIEIPIRTIESCLNCYECCSLGRASMCFNSPSTLYPCAQLYSILSNELDLRGYNIVFDVSKESLRTFKRFFVEFMNNEPGIVKKKIVFKRQS